MGVATLWALFHKLICSPWSVPIGTRNIIARMSQQFFLAGKLRSARAMKHELILRNRVRTPRPGLPDFSRYNIPNIYQMTTKCTKSQ
jgi:hypothetical protein